MYIVEHADTKKELSYADEAHLGWKAVIFVPFGTVWQIVLNMSVFVNAFGVIYILAYAVNEADEMIFEGLHYALETVYLMDTILYVMHRKMTAYRITRVHQPRTVLALCLDALTLLPIYEAYLLLTHVSRDMISFHFYIRRYVRTKIIVRLYRIFHYFQTMKATASSNQLWFIVLEHTLVLTMSVHCLGAIWCSLGCWKCNKPNWTQTIAEEHDFNPKSHFDWFVFSYGTMGNLLLHNYKSEIFSVTVTETLLILSTMVIGHVMQYTIFIGNLIISNLTQQQRHFYYVRRIKDIKNVLNLWRIDNKLKKLILNYYEILWERYSGIKCMPLAYELLPLPLKKEVTLDLFWDALNHSYLFQDEDIPFKRALSLEMENEFYQPGDYVVQINDYKTKMFYISSGVLEVLSGEDDAVAVMSFSSGTVIGEISLMIPMSSTSTIRCVSVCELHTLTLPALYRVLEVFPEKLAVYRSKLHRRIQSAEDLLEEKKIDLKETGDSIIWLKKKWMELSAIQSQRKKRTSEKQGPLIHPSDKYHTVENFGLLVLCEEIDLKMSAICLNTHCPFVLEPTSSLQTFVNGVVLIAILLQIIWIPYVFSFERLLGPSSFSVLFFFDCFYFLDVYLQLSTAIKHKHHTTGTTVKIALERIKKGWFLIDVLAAIPIDYIAYATNPHQRLVVLFKMNRLLKGYKVIRFISKKENDIVMDIITLKFIKYIVVYIIMCYIATCLNYSLACYEEKCYENGWFEQVLKTFAKKGVPFGAIYSPGVEAMYYTLSIMLCVKQSSVKEFVHYEKIARHLLVLLAYCMISLFLAEICAAMVLSVEQKRRYREHISDMKVFLKRCQINVNLRREVASVIEFKWAYNKNVILSGPSGLLADAPEYLKTKVILGRIENCLKKSCLFSECAENVLKDVALVATLRAVPDGVLICHHDSKSNCIYVILRGYCALTSSMAGDKERARKTILTFGDCFPVVETLHQVLLLVDVKSITAVQLISINYDDLFGVLNRHTLEHADMMESIEEHYKGNKLKLHRNPGRLPPMIPPQKSLGHGEMFTYTVPDTTEDNRAKEDFLIPFRKMGKFSFFRYLLCISSVNPKGPLFLGIEMFHYACGLSRTITAILYDNVFFPHKDPVNWFFRGTDVLYVLMVYVRMHVHYYNDVGILVTHPWMTMKRYVSTTFFIDMWSFVPISYSGLYDIIGRDYRIMTGFVIRITSRPVQMHRFIGLLNYLQSNIQSATLYTIQTIKYCTITAVIVGLVSTLFQYHSIKITPNGIFYANNSWIALSEFKEDITLFMVLLTCLNISFTSFTTIFTGTYLMARTVELWLAIWVCCFYFILRVFLFSKLACSRIGSSSRLTVYQENVKSFENFMKDELVDERLVESTIEEHKYLWKNKDVGLAVASLSHFHDHLHVDLVYQLYGNTLKACDAFAGANESFYRQLGIRLKEEYFSKDSEIIRCNDIQKLVYIVKKGRVDIMLANSRLCSVGRGGMFGCFQKHGQIRQTITAVASVHVVVLTIPGSLLHKLIMGYPSVELAMANANTVNSEYLASEDYIEIDYDQASGSFTSSSSKLIRLRERFRWLKIGTPIKDSTKLYKIWNYITCVHVASISAFIYSFVIVMLIWKKKIMISMRIISALLDIYFLIRIYVSAHVIYKDPSSGIVVRDLNLIRKRYFFSLTRFWLDLFTVLPFEYIALAITDNINYTKYGYCPRLMRYWFLCLYYKEQEENLNVRHHLRLTYLAYRVVFGIEWSAIIWWICYCAEGRCRYTTEGLFEAYVNVINIFTINGITQSFNDTKVQMLVFFPLACISIVVLLALVSGYATKVKISTYSRGNYQYNIEDLKIYLQDRDLSPFILNKVWTYCLQLWQRQRGEWMPNLITEAPKCLKEDLMRALYGSHIHTHFLFSKTHTDFTRQLLLHLKRCIFFPGNYIVEKGDVDGCMYFIHKGQVIVIDVQDRTEIARELLVQGKSFGEAQGLFMIPHQFSYKAHTIVDAISLHIRDWEYLMYWFPASKECIFKEAAEFGIRMPNKTVGRFRDFTRSPSFFRRRLSAPVKLSATIDRSSQ